jgi:hypothetical protein
MDPATRRTLRMLARTRSRRDLEVLFASIRQMSDAAIFAVVAEPVPKAQKSADFAIAIAARLAPILGPANEKADMLIDELAGIVGPVEIRPAGLLPTIRKLAARYGEERVAAAAEALMARLKAWGSTREKVT